jgi:hypothetical protein
VNLFYELFYLFESHIVSFRFNRELR